MSNNNEDDTADSSTPFVLANIGGRPFEYENYDNGDNDNAGAVVPLENIGGRPQTEVSLTKGGPISVNPNKACWKCQELVI